MESEPILKLQQGRLEEFYNHAHDERGRFTSKDGSGSGGIAESVVKGIAESGGATISPSTGATVKTGYAVAGVMKPQMLSAADLATVGGRARASARIKNWVKDMAEQGVFDGKDINIGAWEENGRIWIEPSQHVESRGEAERLGKSRHQKAVYGLSDFEEIDTGGSGRFVAQESPLAKSGVRRSRRGHTVPLYKTKE